MPMADEQPMRLLTGASRGIGHATVKLFQEGGWGVLTDVPLRRPTCMDHSVSFEIRVTAGAS
jgi:NAD(P)-dependent dehydrogenase (short-subunit alcohol dehydrogenase family)